MLQSNAKYTGIVAYPSYQRGIYVMELHVFTLRLIVALGSTHVFFTVENKHVYTTPGPPR